MKKTNAKKVALIDPPIEDLAKDAGNKYILCNVVANRAKEIMKEKNDNRDLLEEEYDSGVKEITEAADELANGKLVVEYLPNTITEDNN